MPVTDEIEEQHRVTAIPQKTIAATTWGTNIYSEWAGTRIIKNSTMPNVCNLTTPLLDMKPEEIVHWMGKFVLEIRKKMELNIHQKHSTKLFAVFRGILKQMGSTI